VEHNPQFEELPVRVGLASTQLLLIRRLRAAIGGPMQVVLEAHDATEILALARQAPPDLMLLDGQLPRVEEVIRTLVDHALGTVVVITRDNDPDEAFLMRVLRAGASGFMPAATPTGRFTAALQGVLRGEAALPRSHVGLLLAEFQARPGRALSVRGRRIHLTQREMEVLRLLRQGHTTASIAHRLSIGGTTVRTHLAALQRKARVSSRAELLLALTQ